MKTFTEDTYQVPASVPPTQLTEDVPVPRTTAPRTDSQSRSWFFTYNNPTETAEGIYERLKDRTQFLVLQSELGASGTPHLQGCITYKQATRFSRAKADFPLAHLEIPVDVARARNYCKKTDTRVAGPWEFGDIRALGKKMLVRDARDLTAEDMEEMSLATFLQAKKVQLELAAAERPPRLDPTCLKGPRGIWLCATAGAGKSCMARLLATHFSADCYVKDPSTKWFNGYNGQEIILVDDWDKSSASFSFTALKHWADPYDLTVEVKGGAVPL